MMTPECHVYAVSITSIRVRLTSFTWYQMLVTPVLSSLCLSLAFCRAAIWHFLMLSTSFVSQTVIR